MVHLKDRISHVSGHALLAFEELGYELSLLISGNLLGSILSAGMRSPFEHFLEGNLDVLT
jgi:hypothetical protein